MVSSEINKRDVVIRYLKNLITDIDTAAFRKGYCTPYANDKDGITYLDDEEVRNIKSTLKYIAYKVIN